MNEEERPFIAALNLVDNQIRIHGKTSRLIKKEDVEYNQGKKVIVGGVTTTSQYDRRPAILLEKEGERLSRIIVKCPCGRCSELICEYDEEEEDDVIDETSVSEME